MTIFWQILSLLGTFAGLLIILIKVYSKIQVDISGLNIRITEIEKNLSEHKNENRMEFIEFIRQNNEAHQQIFGVINKVDEKIDEINKYLRDNK